MQEIDQAERDVRPIVGELPSQTSAAGVYRAALCELGHSVNGLADAAMKDIFMTVRHQGARRVAMDSATTTDLEQRFGPGVFAVPASLL